MLYKGAVSLRPTATLKFQRGPAASLFLQFQQLLPIPSELREMGQSFFQKIDLNLVDIIRWLLHPIVHPHPRPLAVRQARVF